MLPHDLMHYVSPAKLNLDLRIIGKLPNGYHALESIFTLIDLHDTLCITSRDDGQIVLHTPTPNVLPEQDLTIRAAQLLQTFSGCLKGANIWLDKRIPMGGGLGGGSSNAATVLLVLNHLWRCGLSRQQLIDLGLQLGADVPFFIFGQTAFARGVGEKLQPIDVPQQYYVVVQPNVQVATPKIFAHPDLPRNSVGNPQPTWQNMQPLRNDMQAVVLQDYPEVRKAFDVLAQYGEPRMTGSGACVFLACDDWDEARYVAQKVGKWQPENGRCWCVKGIMKHPLFSLLSNG